MPSAPRSRRAVLPRPVRRLDRRAGHRLYASSTRRPTDAVFARVSTAAEGGVFWVVLGLIVALTGSRGRRAALRGALTLGASSLSANLVAKRLIRARRPVARGLRHRLTRVRTPSSPAFPSGHSATAAALAAGVAAESPGLGAAVGLVALIVSYSRLHVGAHELSDVVAGNLYGGTVGLLGFLLRRPRTS